MALDPVVVNITPPRSPFHLPHWPTFNARWSKTTTAIAAIVISISMVLFAWASFAANNADFKKSHGITSPTDVEQASGVTKSDAALPGGGTATGVGGTSGTNAPVVTITAQPASVTVGSKTHLKWSATNNPTTCEASDDWSGSKPTSGESDTQALTSVQTYIFTLTCKTATGTGFATVSVGAIQQGGTGNAATRPTVHLAANPTSVYVGQDSTLTWDVSNNPSSCTASGNWTGNQSATGSTSTGALTTVKTYTFTLNCENSAGSGFATVTVSATELPPDIPVVSLSISPVGPVAPGSSVTLSWTTINSPSSCTASGNSYWSGSKAASGSQQVGPITTAGSYTFSLTCSNGGGSSNPASTAVTVNNATYCNGNTPCYGPNDLASHNTIANCWGYNLTMVYNITTLNNNYHRNFDNLFPNATSPLCGNVNQAPYLAGTSLSGVGSHNHQSSTKNNTNATFLGFRVGYYDASKP